MAGVRHDDLGYSNLEVDLEGHSAPEPVVWNTHTTPIDPIKSEYNTYHGHPGDQDQQLSVW